MACTRNATEWASAFVADGYDRALDAIEAEVRPEVEGKYTDEWNASGFFGRWFLWQRIEREIADLVAERSQHIAPESLF